LEDALSVLEMEHSRMELERHEESSSKHDGSTDLKSSIKWRGLAVKYRAACRAWATCCVVAATIEPIVATKRFELRETARNLQRVMAPQAAGEPVFSVNGCCDAMRSRG